VRSGRDCRLRKSQPESLRSMISEPLRAGNQRVDERRDDDSCSFSEHLVVRFGGLNA